MQLLDGFPFRLVRGTSDVLKPQNHENHRFRNLIVVRTPWRNLTYLVLETDEGIRGYGEARVVAKTNTVCEYLTDVRRHIIGFDAFDIEDLYRRFTLLDFGLPGEIVMTGLALVEMPCWDCIRKKAKLPVKRSKTTD
jgi:galactonate dehydratase